MCKLLRAFLQIFFIHSAITKPLPQIQNKLRFKPIQNPQSKTQNSSAFTLIELLVAMAVLALVLVLMTQAVNGVLQSTKVQNQQMDSVAAARRAVDVMAVDLRAAVIDDSRTVLVPDGSGSGALFTLFARKRGPENATNHRFLALAYTLSDGRLSRSYSSESFDQSAVPPDQKVDLSEGILGFQMRALTENGANFPVTQAASANWATNSYGGQSVAGGQKALLFPGVASTRDLTNRTVGLEFWVAAVDDQNWQLLESTGKLEAVTNKLASTADPKKWREEVDQLDIAPPAKSAIRILNRTVPMP